MTVTPETGISSNEQLAYLRTLDIKKFMENHIGQFRVANTHYEHFAEIAENVGAQYCRVAVEITVTMLLIKSIRKSLLIKKMSTSEIQKSIRIFL